jgi:hypothetical protein
VHSPSNRSKDSPILTRPWFSPIVLVVAAALLLRVAWVLMRWRQGGAALEFDDERLHWQLAVNLVRDGLLVSDDGRAAARMPAYPLYLAAFAGLGETGVLLARLGQALLGAACAGVACAWVRSAAGARAGLVAGVLVAVDPFGVFFCNLLLNEVAFSLMLLVTAACAWRVATANSGGIRGAVAGLACGAAAAVMTRPEAGLWLGACLLLLPLIARRRREALSGAATAALVAATCVAAWGARNQARLGVPVLLSTNGGVTLYDGHRPGADGGSDQSFLRQLSELEPLNEVQRDAWLHAAAVRRIRDDPWRALQLAGAKLVRTWSPIPNVAAYRSGAAAWGGAAFTVAVAGLALLGTARRRDARFLVLAWLPVVVFTLVSAVFVGSVRYRVPLMPLLCAVAGTAVIARGDAAGPASTDRRS